MLLYLLQLGEGGANPLINFGIIGLMFLVFYFLIIRPQMKKQKDEKKFQTAIKKGNWVVTTGGIHGRVSEVSENTVSLETSAGKIKIEISVISSELSNLRYNTNKPSNKNIN